MKLKVVHTKWSAGGQTFAGGVHDDVKVTRKLAPLIAAAEHAGSIVVVSATREERKLLKPHVQSQADGEKAYAAAQKSGAWHEGNLEQFDLDVAAGVRSDDLSG